MDESLPPLDVAADSPDTLFSVPYNLVSNKIAADYVADSKLETIPVVDSEGFIVAVAQLSDDRYDFHLPVELATEARLGNIYFEFRVNAYFHDSVSDKETRDKDTQAILILPIG